MDGTKFKSYSSKDDESNSVWFHYCKKNQIPFITVKYRTVLADIEFDYITFENRSVDSILINNEDNIRRKIFDIFEKYKNNKSKIISTGWGVVRLDNIELDKAKEAASDLYDFICKLINHNHT